ncbi:ABC transporter substrate-binding protein [Neisseria perflava]|uniref:ABC transporter substrate-binding protein n=1 Tax=Neisseria perflava TaxID=33053 RepID=UPI00209D0929|nr:extracellular solute-binding protein [Neisseria perflava]MCP1660496.1 ABC-type Fe3+ transport system substrate-binding protein [Neisseria perflava]MCP1772045.1 ABC-type Fe3+ transport system substrate-binding protein [Neisseria perflava]
MKAKNVLMAVGLAALTATAQVQAVGLEKQSMEQLYQAALQEGGKLVVYAGGDTPEQQNGIKAAFEKRFPGITLDAVVDYSKVHDARIDWQLANKNVTADVVQLQTLQDFPRWKAEGALLNYKPLGWDKVYRDFKDKDGAWTGVFVDAFSNVSNQSSLGGIKAPREADDYLNPALKGKIISTYPNDDDAVLFWYKQTIDRHGWQWLGKFMQQQPHFVRGTQAPADEVESGKYAATFSTDGMLKPDASAKSRFVLPEKDGFVAWAQRAAILKDAKHPAAAKLYLSWLLDKDTQENVWYMWSVRTDVAPPAGYKHIWQYPNANLKAFERFMADCAAVERFRAEVGLYVGDVQGESSAGVLGFTPVKALR